MQPICLQYCYQREVNKRCNCTDVTVISINDSSNFPPCYTSQQINCSESFYRTFYLNTSFITDYCIPQCPLECNSTSYDPSVSSTRLNSLFFNTIFNSSTGYKHGSTYFNNDDVDNSFVQLNIFYKTLGYSSSNETPLLDFGTLMSNLGGIISLFCGVSLLSAFEIIDVLIETFIIVKKYNKVTPLATSKVVEIS